MVNRRVTVGGKVGTVIRWEPLSMQMCDALVRFDDGQECWYASYSLRPDPGDVLKGIPLPSRTSAREENDRVMQYQLEGIRAKLVKEHRPWDGAEFGKVIVSRAIEGALNEVKSRTNRK